MFTIKPNPSSTKLTNAVKAVIEHAKWMRNTIKNDLPSEELFSKTTNLKTTKILLKAWRQLIKATKAEIEANKMLFEELLQVSLDTDDLILKHTNNSPLITTTIAMELWFCKELIRADEDFLTLLHSMRRLPRFQP